LQLGHCRPSIHHGSPWPDRICADSFHAVAESGIKRDAANSNAMGALPGEDSAPMPAAAGQRPTLGRQECE